MSLEDHSTDELLKKKKKSKIGVRVFAVLFIITLFFYANEQLSKPIWLVLSVPFILISLINAVLDYRINKELKRRGNSV